MMMVSACSDLTYNFALRISKNSYTKSHHLQGGTRIPHAGWLACRLKSFLRYMAYFGKI